MGVFLWARYPCEVSRCPASMVQIRHAVLSRQENPTSCIPDTNSQDLSGRSEAWVSRPGTQSNQPNGVGTLLVQKGFDPRLRPMCERHGCMCASAFASPGGACVCVLLRQMESQMERVRHGMQGKEGACTIESHLSRRPNLLLFPPLLADPDADPLIDLHHRLGFPSTPRHSASGLNFQCSPA